MNATEQLRRALSLCEELESMGFSVSLAANAAKTSVAKKEKKMSPGSLKHSQYWKDVKAYAVEKGITLVAARKHFKKQKA